MAIGILSVAAGLERRDLLSGALLAAAVLTFAVVVVANLIAAGWSSDAVDGWRGDPHRALVLFTWVAACGVLGESVAGRLPPAEVTLGVLAATGWGVGVWVMVSALRGHTGGWTSWEVSGSWLLAVVAPQSLSILASSLAARTGYEVILGAGVAFWIVGIAVYCALIGLIIRRLARSELGIDQLTPDYWITMGALAISTVAALDLSAQAGAWSQPLVAIAGVTLIYSALWIPLMLVSEVVQIRHRRLSFGHDILRWSTVFPLGMFSVASYGLARMAALPDLALVAQGFLWAGLALALLNAGSAVPAATTTLRRIVWCE